MYINKNNINGKYPPVVGLTSYIRPLIETICSKLSNKQDQCKDYQVDRACTVLFRNAENFIEVVSSFDIPLNEFNSSL